MYRKRLKPDIDLKDFILFFIENKNKMLLITILVMLLGLFYNIFILKPVYEYTAFIKIPNEISVKSTVNSVSDLKKDIGKYEGLREIVYSRRNKTLKIILQHKNYEKLNILGNLYVENALSQINNILHRENKYEDRLKHIENELNDIRLLIDNGNPDTEVILEHLRSVETNTLTYSKAELLNKDGVFCIEMESKLSRNMIITFFIGILCSIAFVFGKYLKQIILLNGKG